MVALLRRNNHYYQMKEETPNNKVGKSIATENIS